MQCQQGEPGTQGPQFAEAVIVAITTMPPETEATVTVSFDCTNGHFSFGIPRGADGQPGQQGEPCIQGPPGEVTTAQLNLAIGGTSNNTNAVTTLDTPFADPDCEALHQKMTELILAVRRS